MYIRISIYQDSVYQLYVPALACIWDIQCTLPFLGLPESRSPAALACPGLHLLLSRQRLEGTAWLCSLQSISNDCLSQGWSVQIYTTCCAHTCMHHCDIHLHAYLFLCKVSRYLSCWFTCTRDNFIMVVKLIQPYLLRFAHALFVLHLYHYTLVCVYIHVSLHRCIGSPGEASVQLAAVSLNSCGICRGPASEVLVVPLHSTRWCAAVCVLWSVSETYM